MSKSTFLVVCLSIAVGYILAMGLNRTSAGHPPAPEAFAKEGQVWRYQLMGAGQGSFPTLFVTFDTVTGRVWRRDSDERERGAWHSYGSPASVQPDRVSSIACSKTSPCFLKE